MFYLAERLWHASQARGVEMVASLITNGLLLTPEIVDRLAPFGLYGVKVTLDGDARRTTGSAPCVAARAPSIASIENLRRVAAGCAIGIGGNFDVETADRTRRCSTSCARRISQARWRRSPSSP